MQIHYPLAAVALAALIGLPLYGGAQQDENANPATGATVNTRSAQAAPAAKPAAASKMAVASPSRKPAATLLADLKVYPSF